MNENSRGRVKTMMYVLLFSSNKYLGQNEEGAKLKRAFKEKFRYVYSFIENYKRGSKTRLARILQMIKSTIVIENVARRVREERHNLPILTIHDSVVSLEGEQTYILRVMEEECEKAIGIKPKFRIEKWNQ